jgi:hypothetical protein
LLLIGGRGGCGGGGGLCAPKEISPLLGATMDLEFHCTKFGILRSNQVFCKLFVYVIHDLLRILRFHIAMKFHTKKTVTWYTFDNIVHDFKLFHDRKIMD